MTSTAVLRVGDGRGFGVEAGGDSAVRGLQRLLGPHCASRAARRLRASRSGPASEVAPHIGELLDSANRQLSVAKNATRAPKGLYLRYYGGNATSLSERDPQHVHAEENSAW